MFSVLCSLACIPEFVRLGRVIVWSGRSEACSCIILSLVSVACQDDWIACRMKNSAKLANCWPNVGQMSAKFRNCLVMKFDKATYFFSFQLRFTLQKDVLLSMCKHSDLATARSTWLVVGGEDRILCRESLFFQVHLLFRWDDDEKLGMPGCKYTE